MRRQKEVNVGRIGEDMIEIYRGSRPPLATRPHGRRHKIYLWTTIDGDIDLSGTITVGLRDGVLLTGVDTLKLHATGVLDDNGSLMVSGCDPKDGMIIGTDPCP